MRFSLAAVCTLTLMTAAVLTGGARTTTQGTRPGLQAPPPAGSVDMERIALQVLLDRAGFSPGEIDGRQGRNTSAALEAFQRARGLERSGRPDAATLEALRAADRREPLVRYAITGEDIAGPFTTAIPDDLMEQATLPALGYTSVVEMLGERFHASPRLLQALNPGATFSTAGEVVLVPDVADETPGATNGEPVPAGTNGRRTGGDVTVIVSKAASALAVMASDGHVLFHAPVTTGSEHDPLPLGDWKVTAVLHEPKFHYNPELFWDADPSHAKATIAPGPNNPVGLVWIDLTREHYGLHGTPEPGQVGHTASHGCVRLTNWDALRVAALVGKDTPVRFVE